VPSPKIKALAKSTVEYPLREDFLNSLGDIEKLEPATLKLFGTDPQTDEPIEDGDPIAEANFVHLQSVEMPQEERVQMAISSTDEGKLFTYGRTTRMYAVSGFLVDSNREEGGHLMSEWDLRYNNYFRLTACLKDRRLNRLRWRLTSMYGYLLSNVKGIESSAPNVCMVNFTFLSLFEMEDLKKMPVLRLGDDIEIAGKASYESLSSLGFVPDFSSVVAIAAKATAVGAAVDESVKRGGRRIVDKVGGLL
jgi:hypothetical protein